MEVDRVILHVGWPKTATTSVQSQLRGYPNLAGKPFGRDGALAARKVVDDLVRSSDWNSAALEELIDSSWHDRTLPVLLSNESLIEMPQREWFDGLRGPFEAARRLAQLSCDTRIFMTLREPREMLRSTWLHHVREGRLQTYSEFLERLVDDRARGCGPFAFDALARTYGDLFGSDHVVIAFTEDYSSDPVRFWNRFVNVLEIESFTPDAAIEVPRLNETNLGPIGFELGVNRLLGLYARLLRRDETRGVRRAITRRVSRRLAVDHSRFFLRSEETEDRLVTDLDEDVATIRKRFTVL